MATNTSRVKLRQPQRGNAGDPNDPVNVTIDWNNNADVMDDGIGAPSYTSATHSATPFDGKCEYETDTGLLAVWDASAVSWIKYAVDGSQGNKGTNTVGVDSADFTSASGESGPLLPVTFTSEVGVRYWYEFYLYLEQSAGSVPANCTLRVRFAAGASVTTAGTQIGSDFKADLVAALNQEIDFDKIYEFVPNVAGNVTVGVFLVVNSAGDTVHMEANNDENQCFSQVRSVGV